MRLLEADESGQLDTIACPEPVQLTQRVRYVPLLERGVGAPKEQRGVVGALLQRLRRRHGHMVVQLLARVIEN